VLLEDKDADAFDVDDNNTRRVQQCQWHGVIPQTQGKSNYTRPLSLSFPLLCFSVKQKKEKDEEDSSQQWVTEIGAAPPPEKGEYPQIFGCMLRLVDVKVIKRQ
jgi:hypothetical protein